MKNSNKTMPTLQLSLHACKRARQRLQWNTNTLERMAQRALSSGLKRNNTKGSLKKYLDEKYEKYPDKKLFYLYGETVYLFSDEKKLITMWQLPLQFRSLAKVLREKLQNNSLALVVLSCFPFDFLA